MSIYIVIYTFIGCN